jgi:hypothetical protein
MPTVAIYIRKANLQKYLSMENPSEWINTVLANTDDVSQYGSIKQTPAGPAVTVLSETLPAEDEEPDLTWLATDYPTIRFRGDFKQFFDPETRTWINTKGKFY